MAQKPDYWIGKAVGQVSDATCCLTMPKRVIEPPLPERTSDLEPGLMPIRGVVVTLQRRLRPHQEGPD
jgi:hypothetical protein